MQRGSSAEEKKAGVLQEKHMKGERVNTEILIVGGGIAGLATALALHRIGMKSLVLEHSESLRAGGTSIALWMNAWCALEALGVASELRKDSWPLDRFEMLSKNGELLKELCFRDDSKWRHELRSVQRKLLLETLARPLPPDTIRFSSRVVAIHKGRKASRSVVELEGGTFVTTKVLVGCDGVHSVVAKWMGLPEPTLAGRSAIRGLVTYPDGHKGEPVFRQVLGDGVRLGFIPINATQLYWFILHTQSPSEAPEKTWDSELIRQQALELVRGFPQHFTDMIKATQAETLASSTLRVRWLWPVIMGPRQLMKGGVTVAGDAMHVMTPDIGQGGCSALEDAVVLARSIAGAMKVKTKKGGVDEEEEEGAIEKGLGDYVRERQGRVFGLSLRAYIVGRILSSRSGLIKWLRDAILIPRMTAATFMAPTQYRCGPLTPTRAS